jgi:hypothetical protein
MLDGQTEYFLSVLGLAVAMLCEFRQKTSYDWPRIQYDCRVCWLWRPRDGALVVVPDASRILQMGQPFAPHFHLSVTDIVKQLSPVS